MTTIPDRLAEIAREEFEKDDLCMYDKVADLYRYAIAVAQKWAQEERERLSEMVCYRCGAAMTDDGGQCNCLSHVTTRFQYEAREEKG